MESVTTIQLQVVRTISYVLLLVKQLQHCYLSKLELGPSHYYSNFSHFDYFTLYVCSHLYAHSLASLRKWMAH
jgi:hypothetical protein